MAKKTVHIKNESIGWRLYTEEDVRRVNAIRVRCCKSSYGIDRNRPVSSKPYSASDLNSAWKKVSK